MHPNLITHQNLNRWFLYLLGEQIASAGFAGEWFLWINGTPASQLQFEVEI